MIAKVLTTKGMAMDISKLIAALEQCWPNDPYAKNKAYGSLGGAVTNHFISIGTNGMVRRIR